jgi:hypothetical protein
VTTHAELQRTLETIEQCTDLDQLKFKLRVLAGEAESIASASPLRAGGVANFYADDVETLAHDLEALAAVLHAGAERMRSLP